MPSVIQEIEEMVSRYPQIKYISVNADEFLSMPLEDINSFCELYKKKINLPFSISASPQNVTDEKISQLVDAGLCVLALHLRVDGPRRDEHPQARENHRAHGSLPLRRRAVCGVVAQSAVRTARTASERPLLALP